MKRPLLAITSSDIMLVLYELCFVKEIGAVIMKG